MKTLGHFIKSLFLFLILSSQIAAAQDSTAIRKIKSLAQHFVAFSKEYPREKVYLHFDNTAYYLGETIWFKAYAVRADRNALSPYSKILYVELLNTEGNVIDTKKYKLENGQCHGEFILNQSNYGGFYEVRAYTRYMMNFGADNYFSRVFPIYDAPKIPGDFVAQITERPNSQRIPTIRPQEPVKNQLNVTFFPEGGNLVQDASSKVAFKSTNRYGENAIITGTVYDDKNEKIADINTEFEGMGSFEFTPAAAKYHAQVSCEGHNYRIELPAVLPKGYTLSVLNDDDDKLTVVVQKNNNTTIEALGLNISCRGILYAFESVNMGNDNTVAYNIPKKMLPSGVCQFTLYNTSGDILSERLAFVNHMSQMKITATPTKPAYNPFERIAIDFQMNDIHDKAIETTFSVAIRDESVTPYNPFNSSMLSDLLLSSELKGYIENPGFYFQSDDKPHHLALDLLMLTQGWTRYSWKQIAGITPVTIKQPIEKQLFIDGTIASVILKKKMKNVDVSMVMFSDSVSQQGKCKTDSVGDFNFGLVDFKGSAKLILQSKVKDKRKDTRIMLNRQFAPDPRSYYSAEKNATQHYKIINDSTLAGKDSSDTYYSNKNNSKLSMSERENLLKQVTVKEKYIPMKISLKYDVNKEMDRMEDTGEWEPTDIYGFLQKTNDYVTTSMDSSGNMKIKYKGKDVRFLRRDSKTFATEVGDDNSSSGSDGGANPDRNFKGRLPLIDEIESISIIEDFGTIMRMSGGSVIDPTKTVLAVMTLKKGYQPVPNGVRSTSFTGYAFTKEFYSPQYGRYRTSNEKDYRRTLYWNPDVKTDKSGHARIMFFNNNCKAMNISAETVTENGVIGVYNK